MLAPGGVRDAANPHPDSVRAFLPPFQLKPPAIAYFMLGGLLSEGQQRRHTGRGQAQPAIAQMTDRSVGSVNAMRTEIPPDSTCDSWV